MGLVIDHGVVFSDDAIIAVLNSLDGVLDVRFDGLPSGKNLRESSKEGILSLCHSERSLHFVKDSVNIEIVNELIGVGVDDGCGEILELSPHRLVSRQVPLTEVGIWGIFRLIFHFPHINQSLNSSIKVGVIFRAIKECVELVEDGFKLVLKGFVFFLL